jgi:hypothetical protein
LERKMCSISVEPMPSRISTPVFSWKLLEIWGGRASPAEIHVFNPRSFLEGKAGEANMPA